MTDVAFSHWPINMKQIGWWPKLLQRLFLEKLIAQPHWGGEFNNQFIFIIDLTNLGICVSAYTHESLVHIKNVWAEKIWNWNNWKDYSHSSSEICNICALKDFSWHPPEQLSLAVKNETNTTSVKKSHPANSNSSNNSNNSNNSVASKVF